jgi:hypothetical protein
MWHVFLALALDTGILGARAKPLPDSGLERPRLFETGPFFLS